ncbi:50S ribosomal protein L6 [Chitinibacteraceae bacterium HSL-7]
MSRVAKNPVAIPSGVEAKVDGGVLTVKGGNGSLSQALPANVEVKIEGGALVFAAKDGSKGARALSGTLRALANNMVTGVSKGFERKLNLVGVGYRAQAAGDVVNLTLGFSHPVAHKLPVGVKAETPSQTEIILKSADKQLLGQVAADIRAYRSPEPYKGKGVRYSDEVVVLKETKKK